LAVELEEELGIKAIPNLFIQLGAYENIRPNNDDWHWVIHVLVLRTLTLETLVNKEPDKHPEIRLFNARDLHQGDFWGLQWAPKLGDFLNLHRWKITDTLTNLCDI
jgi:ADP-ribose pyrophosphatase YjhB (NUDIX family)